MKRKDQHQPSVFEMCRQAASGALRLAVLGLAAVLLTGSAQAQTFTVLHTFTGTTTDGSNPTSGVILDANGNLYGTTPDGGSANFGTLYRIDTTATFSLLASFTTDQPFGLPFLDKSGNFYGTGSTRRDGSVWKVNKSGSVSTIWSFTGGKDGEFPFYTGLTSGPTTGDLYGVTLGIPQFLGPCNPPDCGTLYKLDVKTRHLTTLHVFFGKETGLANPGQGLIEDANHNMYGSAACSGASGEGGLFEFTQAGKYEKLYTFKGSPCSTINNVGGPWADTLVLDGHGNLYGMTTTAGKYGLGMVFKFSPSSRQLTVLHNFTGGSDGKGPWGGVVLDAKGNLYGTAQGGGKNRGGTVFEINTAGKYRVLHSFTFGGSDGSDPVGLAIDKSGNLYGATNQSGDSTCNCGTVFKLTP